jgi:hypothetical protein
MSFQILVFLIEYDDKSYSRRYLEEKTIQFNDEKFLNLKYENINLNKYFKNFVLQIVYQFNDSFLQPYLFKPLLISESKNEVVAGIGRNLTIEIENFNIKKMKISIELKMLMNTFPLRNEIMTVSEFLLEFK